MKSGPSYEPGTNTNDEGMRDEGWTDSVENQLGLK